MTINGLSEGQVLQRLSPRGATAVIQVNCAQPNAIVRLTITQNGRPLTEWRHREAPSDRRGHFQATLKNIPCGGPYGLIAETGPKKAIIKSFYVGDVWVLAGQSNMKGVGNREGAAKPHPKVRAFSFRRTWRLAADPLHIYAESPDACHNQAPQCSVSEGNRLRRGYKKGVGIGVYFGIEMLRRTGVPQGLICAAHGGTKMRQWDPALKKLGGHSLYGSLITSLQATGQPIAGVLWSQGESDTHEQDAAHYTARMKRLVASLRRDLKQPGLPWIVIQSARRIVPDDDQTPWWSFIREQQRRLPACIPRLETIAAIDLPMDDPIHLAGDAFATLSLRAASAAALLRGDLREDRPPQLGIIRRGVLADSGGYRLDVSFTNVRGSLLASGEPHGFQIVNAQGIPEPIIHRVTLHKNSARLHLTPGCALGGCRVGYGLGYRPVCNIQDTRGFSLPAFGPLPIDRPRAWLPYMTTWNVSDVLPSEPLSRVALKTLRTIPQITRSYHGPYTGFVSESERWSGRSGLCLFSGCLELPEAMNLEFRMGYDGPFRLWLDERPRYADLKGQNPAIADAHIMEFNLRRGMHPIHIALDLRDGRTEGFFLRFVRTDVAASAVRAGTCLLPTYHP